MCKGWGGADRLRAGRLARRAVGSDGCILGAFNTISASSGSNVLLLFLRWL